MRTHHRFRREAALAAALALTAATLAPATATAAPDAGPAVKVNQVAYVPGLPKQATVVNGSGSPAAWSLRDASGATVASGQTSVRGADALSGDSVHTVDFSSFDTPGTGYVLSVAGATSNPFDISADPLKRLRYDALAFFYHQRSGTPIQAEYVGSQYARPAGHLDVAPNRGDSGVPCRVSCGYTSDVRGGWYDAGDHGKYGVDTGIAAWQLINEYERTRYVTGADGAALGDGKLAIPERGNGVPDILDEARWGVEFLMKMQVPQGRTDAGMVRHKVSDENWTALPLRPDQDPQPRLLSAVTTAATLNLAAVAAQAARVWRDLDADFASRALTAAERAYAAAKANPTRYADPDDGNGGGTYVDNNVTDEFFWAAAELFTTTGASGYRADVTGSSFFRGKGFDQGGFDWWWTAGLGDTTLALVPNGLSASDVSATRAAFASYGDRLLGQASTQGYPAPASGYYWGSNGVVANAANVLALAHDFTGQAKYRAGVYQALDYLFGRNPFNHSYVTGYGERATRNSHHRFWADQLDSSLPNPPAGLLAGGPNTDLQDPVAQQQLAGCKPQKCYLDDINAWSVNEVALNWNAALAWLSAWAAEKAGSGSPADTTAPGTPAGLTASASGGSVSLSWGASTDDVGVTGYDVLRATGSSGTFTRVATASGTSYTDSGLAPGAYRYQVRARDAAGNTSAASSAVQVTVPGGGAGCTVVATTQSQWGTGYVVQPVRVTNTGTSTITWAVTFTLPAGDAVVGSWNAAVTTGGQAVTARATRSLAPGATAEFGFQASRPNGSTALPSGYTCTG
ncbi:glycoside hydrolase family 9 protein [Saccharothrix texasensis]|uniref:Endoglucanase n=1 Tax=Saccharothrix texasensis TaxID=103734 RepID=A0A3N1GZW2_9PSEU|nr:glycoside hydrolase family 9 protein [Saccharothrix texasensis]ROP35841.1 cellulose 1,4-beta-cellobiosidase [Saccharothrix texasensis]